MKRLVITCMVFIFALSGMSQSCLPQGILFSSQAQIDSFPIVYPDCHRIEGDVDISGTDIINVNGLSNVTSIGGYLYVNYCSKLARFTGLSNLTSIGKYLRIFNNKDLISLDGLENLDSIGDYLYIVSNSRLSYLTGLNNLGTINSILIRDNPALTDVSSFNKLTWVQYLNIVSNSSLTDISGFDHLNSVFYLTINYCGKLRRLSGFDTLAEVYSLNISVNPALKTIDGFKNLRFTEDLKLVQNTSLTDLSGFGNLHTVGNYLTFQLNNSLASLVCFHSLAFVGKLYIDACFSLKSLMGLENIQAENIEQIRITNNDSLSDCAITSICEYMAIPASLVEIHSNGTGCSSKAEVDTVCRHLSLENSTLNTGFKTYPNPSSQFIMIETERIFKECTLNIFDLSGCTLIESRINDRKTPVDIGKLPPGIYIVRIMHQEGVSNFKLIKE